MSEDSQDTPPESTKQKPSGKKKKAASAKRKRVPRIYPALTFEESLVLGAAIHEHASGEKVSRLTLLKKMNRSQTSGSTQLLFTSSGQYGVTRRSYTAEYVELTEKGHVSTDAAAPAKAKAKARIELGIQAIKPFDILYERYRGKKLPSHEGDGRRAKGSQA